MKKLATLVLLSFLSLPALAADLKDEAAIRAAALDYAESWYTGAPDRMTRALHPDLAKRIARRDKEGKPLLDHMTAEKLIESVGKGYGTKTPAEMQLKDVKILDVYENVASVRLDMSGWIDYMHLAKIDGQWKIVNVLWELKPKK